MVSLCSAIISSCVLVCFIRDMKEGDFLLNLKDICNDSNFPPIKIFFSRRNKVYLKEIRIDGDRKYIVVKEHPDEQMASQEVKVLNNLYEKEVRVPFCYGQYDNKVVTRYVPGVLLNILVDNFTEYGADWITELANWYFTFHSNNLNKEGKVLLKADNNLRNFIYHQGRIYGLDFETPIYGIPEEDLGECCAYILTNSPAFTEEKYFIIKGLINAYIKYDSLISIERVTQEIINNLFILSERRPNQKAEILTNIEAFQLNFHF